MGLRCAIIGSGNIGTDLMMKIRRSGQLELAALIGIDPASDGLARARGLGVEATPDGIRWVADHRDRVDLVLDATSAHVHVRHAAVLADLGIPVIDLTPAALGPKVIPPVNLAEHLDAPNLNMVTCGGQATTPIVAAVSRAATSRTPRWSRPWRRRSAGPGTRQNIDEFTRTTARALEEIGGAAHGKAIIILNPADPPILMRNTVFCALPEGTDHQAVLDSVRRMVGRGGRLRPRLPAEEPPGHRGRPVRHPGRSRPAPGGRPAGGRGRRGLPALLRGQPGHHDRGRGPGRRGQGPAAGGGGGVTATDFRLTDSTLRDGSHAVRHQYTRQQVTDIVAGLDQAGVAVLEVAHGDGLGGSSFNYGFSGTDDLELIAAAVAAAQTAKIACLLIPGIGTAEDLRAVADLGASVARIATHCTEADIAEQHLGMAKELGLEAVGFLMMAHMIEPEQLLEQARKMQDCGADVVYCVDSAGAMTTPMARARIEALVAGLDIPVGIHAHENLSLSVANSLAALEAGALHVDGCAAGPARARATARPRSWSPSARSWASRPGSTCWPRPTSPRRPSGRRCSGPRWSTGPR